MPPNILIFMSDQEQADVLDPAHPCPTPNADRLAREGLRFTQTYCPTAHCCPSRATFFSGLYPSRHGVYNNVATPTAIHRGLNDGVRLFSEDLSAAGYNLAYAGKWHVTAEENPEDRGWRQLHITAGKNASMGQGIDSWRTGQSQQPSTHRMPGTISRPGWGDYTVYDSYASEGKYGYEEHSDYRIVSSALEALPELAAADQPWCLYIGVNGPHDPFVVPTRFLDAIDPATVTLPESYADSLEGRPGIYRRMQSQLWDQLPQEEVRESIRHYWAYCHMVDALLGRVLDALDETGQAEETIVLRLSDHGDYCGAHGLYLKGVPAFREAYQVPFIARWPQGINPGYTEDAFVSLADFAPTLYELAGIDIPPGLSGRSLTPLFKGLKPADWRDTLYSQFNGVELYYSQRAVWTKQHKYVFNGFDFDELYDLEADPHEMNNLAEDPAYNPIKHDLVQRMWRFAADQDDTLLFNPYGTVALAPWGPGDAFHAE